MKRVQKCSNCFEYRIRKIRGDFVERVEGPVISLVEGNLTRAEQKEEPVDPSLPLKRMKICSRCVYAKVLLLLHFSLLELTIVVYATSVF
jgi:hypothetical protein